jgi:hypothetical protein
MGNWAEINYRGFHDVPGAFVVWHRGRQFLFLREFDDDLDDYQSSYRVFSLPGLSNDVVESSWAGIENLATSLLGEVPVLEVKFDASRRKKIDTEILERLLIFD